MTAASNQITISISGGANQVAFKAEKNWTLYKLTCYVQENIFTHLRLDQIELGGSGDNEYHWHISKGILKLNRRLLDTQIIERREFNDADDSFKLKDAFLNESIVTLPLKIIKK